MKGLLRSFGIVVCVLAASILVAIANVAVARITGFDFFTFPFWITVPAGAIFIGFAAASGCYFGSLYLHKKPTAILLVQMVAIAGLAQLLIYWLGYATLRVKPVCQACDLHLRLPPISRPFSESDR